MMVAQAGTSGTKGVVYRYYACVRQKKHQCEKKPVSKTKLEDFIVYKTMEFLKDDDIIEIFLLKSVMTVCSCFTRSS